MSDPVSWDAGLIRRYDKAGPLYTAYPPTAQYCQGMLPGDLLAALKGGAGQGRPLSLSVHLPFCANACHFCYCTRVVTRDRRRVQAYLAALYREIDLLGSVLSPACTVNQLHLGGGTPTFFSHQELTQLMDKLRSGFTLHDDDAGDYSVEIDPREANWPTLGLLRELGFNHVVLGVQDLDPEVQRAINRLQSREETQAVMDAARTLAYRSVHLHLMYGLPRQTVESFSRTLSSVIAMQPDRLTLRNYVHLPQRYASQRHIRAADLPAHDSRLEIYISAHAQLSGAGYRFIGMGQYAFPDDGLSLAREADTLTYGMQGYVSGVGGDLLGLGVSAVSQVGDICSRNTCDIAEYQQQLQEGRLPLSEGLMRTADDRLRRTVIQRLMCQWRLSYREIEQRFNIDFVSYFADCFDLLRQMDSDGMIRLEPSGLEVLPAGRPLLASICGIFDAYQHRAGQGPYAQSI